MEKMSDENTNSFAENIEAEEVLPDLALQKLEDSSILKQNFGKITPGLSGSFNPSLSGRNDL